MTELVQDKEEIIGQLLDLLAERNMDLKLEFEDFKLKWGGMEAKLTGKALIAAKNRPED